MCRNKQVINAMKLLVLLALPGAVSFKIKNINKKARNIQRKIETFKYVYMYIHTGN